MILLASWLNTKKFSFKRTFTIGSWTISLSKLFLIWTWKLVLYSKISTSFAYSGYDITHDTELLKNLPFCPDLNLLLFDLLPLNWWASLVAQRLKCLPPMRETRVRSLGQEDPLEKEMAVHSSILAWRIPWTEKPSRLQSTGSQRVGHDWATSPHLTIKLGRKMSASS